MRGKNAVTAKKQGIGFALATLIFNDPQLLSRRDSREDYGEERWNSLGIPVPGRDVLLHVTHTYKEEENGEEIIRIVSARKATKSERERYSKSDD